MHKTQCTKHNAQNKIQKVKKQNKIQETCRQDFILRYVLHEHRHIQILILSFIFIGSSKH